MSFGVFGVSTLVLAISKHQCSFSKKNVFRTWRPNEPLRDEGAQKFISEFSAWHNDPNPYNPVVGNLLHKQLEDQIGNRMAHRMLVSLEMHNLDPYVVNTSFYPMKKVLECKEPDATCLHHGRYVS